MTSLAITSRAGAALITAAWLAACEPAAAPEPQIPDRLELTGPAAPVTAGFTVQMHALVFDTKDKLIEDAVIEWESSNPTVAPVDEFGFIVTQRPGASIITATSGEFSESYNLTVVGTPCHVWPTLGASTTASGSVAGSVAGTDCIFANGLPSKGHAITLASPATIAIEVQGAGLVPVVAVASSTWGLSYSAETGTTPGSTLRVLRSLPAGDFVIWIASELHTNASYTLTTSVVGFCSFAALTATLAPGDSLTGAIGPTSCLQNGITPMQGWRIIAAPDEEIVVDVVGSGGSPGIQLMPSDHQVSVFVSGGGAPTATLGFVPAAVDTFALWVSMQNNTHSAFSIRRRLSQLPTCLSPTDTIAVGDTIQRLMHYGDCERGSTGVRMHTYLLELDSTSHLDIRMATGFFPTGFAVRTLAGVPLHIAQFDTDLHVSRVRATLTAGAYLVTASSPFPGAIGLYTISMVADTLP